MLSVMVRASARLLGMMAPIERGWRAYSATWQSMSESLSISRRRMIAIESRSQ
jgi:hypothetical protein